MPEANTARIQPLEPGSLSARAYLALREALIAGRFRPGQRLLLQDLAARLGTSITPAREACLRLVSERALELRSGRFVTIPDLTLARYMEIRTIRLALEGLAAALATERVVDEDIAALESIQSRFAAADRAGDSDAAMHLNREFHFMVYRLPGLETLTGLIESLWLSMGPILAVFYTETTNDYVGADEHLNLIDALRRRNADDARKAIEQDIRRGGASLFSYLNAREAVQVASVSQPSRRRRS